MNSPSLLVAFWHAGVCPRACGCVSGFVQGQCFILSVLVMAVLGLPCCVGPALVVVSSSLAVAALVGCPGFSHRGFSHCGARAPVPWTSELRLQPLRSGSGVGAHGLSALWHLPGPGVEAGSPGLAGRVFTTEPLRKPLPLVFSKQVQFSRSVVSESLRPHESQHARPSCPSPTPGVYSDSCPSSQ